MKKLSVALVAVLMTVLLSGCWWGEVHSGIKITSEKGAGTKTLSMVILKDHVEKPDKNGKVEDNSHYFPNGMKPVLAHLKKVVPAGFKVEMKDQKDQYVFLITYTFKDINDYNAKTKKLVTDAVWKEKKLKPATIKAATAKGGKNVTFTEDPKTTAASVEKIIKDIYLNGDLFDPTHGGHEVVTLDLVYQVKDVEVTVGNSKAKKFILDDKNKPVTSVSHTGFVKAAAKK